MTKRYQLLFAALFLTVSAQAQFYNFSKTTGTYQPLNTTTRYMVDTFSMLDTVFRTTFRIPYFGKTFGDSVIIDGTYNYLTDFENDELSAVYADVIPRGDESSSIAHITEGTAPNRIFKIEYAGMAFNYDTSQLDSTHFQVWYYENGIIEFRYGPGAVDNSASWAGASGPGAYLISWESPAMVIEGLKGDPTNPTKYNNIADYDVLNDLPPNGTIYRFTPATPNNIQSTENKKVSIADLSNNKFLVQSELPVTSIMVYDIQGRGILKSSGNFFEINNQAPGVYLVHIATERGFETQKVRVQ